MLLHYDFKILSIRETCTRDRYAVLNSTTPYDPSLGATVITVCRNVLLKTVPRSLENKYGGSSSEDHGARGTGEDTAR